MCKSKKYSQLILEFNCYFLLVTAVTLLNSSKKTQQQLKNSLIVNCFCIITCNKILKLYNLSSDENSMLCQYEAQVTFLSWYFQRKLYWSKCIFVLIEFTVTKVYVHCCILLRSKQKLTVACWENEVDIAALFIYAMKVFGLVFPNAIP